MPSNPVAAASGGAMLPVILFALAGTRTTPATRETMVGFFRALGEAMLTLVRWIILAAPSACSP